MTEELFLTGTSGLRISDNQGDEMTDQLPDYRFVTTADLQSGIIRDNDRREIIRNVEKHTFPEVVRWPGAREEIERRSGEHQR